MNDVLISYKITLLEKGTLGTYYFGNAIYPPVVSTSLGFFAFYTGAASIIWSLKLEYASSNVLRKTVKKKNKKRNDKNMLLNT